MTLLLFVFASVLRLCAGWTMTPAVPFTSALVVATDSGPHCPDGAPAPSADLPAVERPDIQRGPSPRTCPTPVPGAPIPHRRSPLRR